MSDTHARQADPAPSAEPPVRSETSALLRLDRPGILAARAACGGLATCRRLRSAVAVNLLVGLGLSVLLFRDFSV